MITIDPVLWFAAILAGFICGTVRGLSGGDPGALSPRRRFLRSYVAVPMLTVALLIVYMICVGILNGFSTVIPAGVFFGLFSGSLIGIPSAAISCMVVEDMRIRRKPRNRASGG